MTSIFLFSSLLVLLLIGTPIAIALGLSSVLTLFFFSSDSLASVALKLFEATQHYTLLAIPFFILSSAFLTTGGVSRRLIHFANTMVGHVRGGLAMASVLACMFFAAVSGSSPATVVAIGSVVIAGMVQAGYSKKLAAGVVCSAGSLGMLIPPSIVMVVYAAATDVSVEKIFIAGVIPGIMAGTMMMVGIYVVARIKQLPCQPRSGWREKWAAFREAAWGLFLSVIILGGIYGGIFTPTEAAAVAAVYSFIVAVFIYRDLGPLKGKKPYRITGLRDKGNGFFGMLTALPGELIVNTAVSIRSLPQTIIAKDVKNAVLGASVTSIMLMFIVINASLFGYILTTERIPQVIAEVILNTGLGPIGFLLIVNLMLLAAGNFMEPTGLLLIMVPILFPIAMKLGIDPIHLGIIMVVNMEVGMLTPPVGLNLFVTAATAKMEITDVIKAALPWILLLLVFLMMITYIPQITLWLPNFLLGK